MQSNDYANVQPQHSLFSNREDRKNTRFKKNHPGNERGYGKQKYSSHKSSSVSSQGNAMNNSQNVTGHPGVLPHSLLEKEIRQIMNQS